jgi:hypothetical protein
MIINGPIAMLEAERSADPLVRMIAAGTKLSNMAYGAGVNGQILTPQQWIAAHEEWDSRVREFVESARVAP